MADPSRVHATLDARADDAASFRGWPPLCDWIREHGVNPNDVYRLEVRTLDTAYVRFYRYDRDENDHLFVDEAARPEIRPAVLPPLDVPQKSMMPVRTLGE